MSVDRSLIRGVERHGSVSVVRLAGSLDIATAAELRTTLLKCLTDEPDLLVVDVAEMVVADDVALTVFPTMARHADAWPGTRVVLAGALPPTAVALDRMAICRYLPLYGSADEAIRNADRHPGPARFIAKLSATPDATSLARHVVMRACESWDVGDIAEVAQLIVTELVSNVLRHARTDMELSVARHGRYLHLSVRDRSTRMPRLGGGDGPLCEDGRGLMVIEALAVAWGSTPVNGGKVVWATLRSGQPAVR